jgi:hypothetical protein
MPWQANQAGVLAPFPPLAHDGHDACENPGRPHGPAPRCLPEDTLCRPSAMTLGRLAWPGQGSSRLRS